MHTLVEELTLQKFRIKGQGVAECKRTFPTRMDILWKHHIISHFQGKDFLIPYEYFGATRRALYDTTLFATEDRHSR